ncbi:MAG TPA: methyltransferase domain-containing protein [Microbacteriaceae bacterium]
MDAPHTLDELIAEGAAAPVGGWDFSWFDGRATEERTPWGYSRLIGERMSLVASVLDVQTGGAEVYAGALAGLITPPGTVAATESWPPNLAIARERLRPFGGSVTEAADEAPFPFADAAFELVTSRHPTYHAWGEITRVLAPGGTFLGQLIGSGTNRELFEFFMGPQPVGRVPQCDQLADAVAASGLELVTITEASTRVEFFDVAAVIVFLRKVIWTVPDFTVERYLGRIAAMHEHIQQNGSFVAHSKRVLLKARRPT